VVIAGGVAKGAFEAGALLSLTRAGLNVVRIVAASAGALNGVVYAGAVRGAQPEADAAELVRMWHDEGDWSHVLSLSARAMWRREGLADASGVLEMLRRAVRPGPAARAVELVLVVASLGGVKVEVGDGVATRHEWARCFPSEAFATREAVEDVFRWATASAAFPGVFAPIDLPGLGACVDGGAVNNSPLGYALHPPEGGSAEVDAVILVSPYPRVLPPAGRPGGLALVERLADLLINERINRDLKAALSVNQHLEALDSLRHGGQLTDDQHHAVLAALGWQHRRRVDVVEIRPANELAGNPFAGFGSASLRASYVAAGQTAADQEMTRRGWLAPS
jgi:NTE family protein